MNSKYEEGVANLRGINKSVKYITKKLGLKKDAVEQVIATWILKSDPYIDEMISGKKSEFNPTPFEMVELIKKLDDADLFKNEKILSYIMLHRTDHHDRFMDYLRFKLLKSKNLHNKI
jgi:hypothetical protein